MTITITITERERLAFARHEADQRRREAGLTFAERLDMLGQLQRTAARFGHDRPPTWLADRARNESPPP